MHTSSIPKRLQRLTDPPAQLYIQGPLQALLQQPCLAIVGSRAVSPYGQQVTTMLAQAAARAGIVVISGLALGIDSIAHRAALEAQGSTIAVLPGGLKRIYPASHQRLAKQITHRGGALVSEYHGAVSPMKHQFIARNRLIAGLADAVLITEAAERSGSLHTAQFALEDGKDVLVVPGNITSQGSKGVNNLIKVGATPITSAGDLLEYFGAKQPVQVAFMGANREEQTLLDLLQQGITRGSELLARSKLSAAQFNQTLTMLEITGYIKPLGNDHWGLSI